MTKKTDKSGEPLVRIPPEECGPGSKLVEIDGELCIQGVSGAIYKNVVFDREDIMRLWPPKEKRK